MVDGQLSRPLPPCLYPDPRHARRARLRLAMGNADEGHRADGLDDRAPVRDRLREARNQQAAFEIDHRAFRAAETQRAAAEFVLVNPFPFSEGTKMNSGNWAEFPVAQPGSLAHDPGHDSRQNTGQSGQAAQWRDRGRAAELSPRARADQ